ncbi:hypothetical protein N7492_005485 [Penicillium capsulatum]|uniref:SprT-like domain-containing protein n=1 Tax=Penicillium capsulatum TaxID=69766 RepID=A0A9W9IFV2_9EURO|nr:hypothetical protein N7492_005485 [Penicillium capsulatum]KAJ6135414.1 hypothetical protein N7512_000574 [Penicillium capsulatum]
MARLNTSNPLVNHAPRQRTGLQSQSTIYTQASHCEEKNIPGRASTVSAPRYKRSTSPVFDILPDNDATEEREKSDQECNSSSASPMKQKKKRPLKAAHVNSLLLPFQQRPRQRPNIKVETYDYEKENDLVEDRTDLYETTMEPGSQRSSPRRNTPGTARRSQANDRPLSPLSPQTETADEDYGDNSFNSLEDFIVSDNDEPSYHETSDSETEDEKSPAPSPPPKPTRRRLMRGRRPDFHAEQTPPEDSSRAPFSLDPQIPNSVKSASEPKNSPRHMFQDDLHLSTKLNDLRIDDDNAVNSQLETDLTRSIIGLGSSPAQSPKVQKRHLTPMQTESHPPKQSHSPTKGNVRIPPTPHRENSDAFWHQDVTNDWIDHHSHSPRKPQAPGPPTMDVAIELDDPETDASGRDSNDPKVLRVETKAPQTPKTPSKTALKKAKAAEKRAAKELRAEFDRNKAEFAEIFFEELDNAVTGGKILRRAKHTGGVRIIWSKNLLKTAGRASWRTEHQLVPDESGNGPATSVCRDHCKIELADRIIDNELRLLSTLTHEYCHLANYMLSNITTNPHGPSFMRWGKECEQVMKHHPQYGGKIHVTPRHSYEIDYKYQWACVRCGAKYGRFSKSIDPMRVSCGNCNGSLEQVKPKPREVKKKDAKPGH